MFNIHKDSKIADRHVYSQSLLLLLDVCAHLKQAKLKHPPLSRLGARMPTNSQREQGATTHTTLRNV